MSLIPASVDVSVKQTNNLLDTSSRVSPKPHHARDYSIQGSRGRRPALQAGSQIHYPREQEMIPTTRAGTRARCAFTNAPGSHLFNAHPTSRLWSSHKQLSTLAARRSAVHLQARPVPRCRRSRAPTGATVVVVRPAPRDVSRAPLEGRQTALVSAGRRGHAGQRAVHHRLPRCAQRSDPGPTPAQHVRG